MAPYASEDRCECHLPSEEQALTQTCTGTKPDRIEYDEYIRVTCNHGYMASDSAHGPKEACKVSYVRECQADGTLSNR